MPPSMPQTRMQTVFSHRLSLSLFSKVFLRAALPRAEEVETATAERELAERAAAQQAQEAQQEQELNAFVQGFSGKLTIATFEVLQQWVGTRRTTSLVFDNLEAAQQHGSNPGPRGPINLRCHEVSVTHGRSEDAADTQLVVSFLKTRFQSTVQG